MKTTMWVAISLLLVACSDDTKAPPPKDLAVLKNEAKVGDGPATKNEGGTKLDMGGTKLDKGATKDGAVAGIGPAGGQMKSADGKIGLEVPAGALTTTVNFTFKAGVNPPVSQLSTWTEQTGVTSDFAAKTVSVQTTHTSCWILAQVMGTTTTIIATWELMPEPVTLSTPGKITWYSVPMTDAGFKVYWKAGFCPVPA